MKIFCVCALVLLMALDARAGNELGNGGDGYAQEFTALGRRLISSLKAQPDPRITDLSKLDAAIESTRVTTGASLMLRGAEVDAINFPQAKKIHVNRERWKEYDVRQKASLVLHEYLGIAGLNDESYQISSAYLELPDLSEAGGERGVRSVKKEAPAGSIVAEQNLNPPPSGGRWSLGLGTNISHFGGNAGDLYDTSITPELALGFLLGPDWKLGLSFSDANFSFAAVDQGLVASRMRTLTASLEYHFANQKQWNGQEGLDPYVSASVAHIGREQNFSSLNQIGRDAALKFGAGLGANWFVAKKIAIFMEGRVASIFFKDRYDDTYVNSGVEDTTGLLYAANVGVQYVF